MAVTHRTIFNNPAAMIVGVLTCIGLAIVVVDELAGDEHCQTDSAHIGSEVVEEQDVEELDVGKYLEHDQPEYRASQESTDVEPPVRSHRPSTANCDGDGAFESWSESDWLTYLDCLDRRGEHHTVILDEIDRGLAHLSRSLELAVRKSELLRIHATPSEHISFLEGALTRHDTPADARLEQRYIRALVWRGGRMDINRAYQTLRNRGLSTMRQVAETCEGKQALAWLNYSLINRSRTFGEDGAEWDARADRAFIDDYVASDCQRRVHTGKWSRLAEVVGAGILAEQINGHEGKSTLVRHAVEPFRIRNVRALCREAVPAQTDLWQECEARVRFEISMTR